MHSLGHCLLLEVVRAERLGAGVIGEVMNRRDVLGNGGIGCVGVVLRTKLVGYVLVENWMARGRNTYICEEFRHFCQTGF
jgi:hypothetical protein